MKKNISINLQGIIFHIEDDGYEVLSRYLQEVKAYFASYQGHEEIVADIEGRIAELFAARVSSSKQVITLADVQEMTAKMGRVSDFHSSPDEDDEPQATASSTASSTFGPEGPFGPRGTFGKEGPFGPKGPFALGGTTADDQPRRLYRDLAHRKIAGVCAGLAQYFVVNPLWIRLGFLAALLLPNFIFNVGHWTDARHNVIGFGQIAFLAYVVLWIALPKRYDAPEPIDTLSSTGPLAGRKFFRDTDAGKVGGVAAGLAAYFNVDVTLIRVLFLVTLFAGGTGFLAYIILWVVVPEARTVSEKMQMRGDAVTLSGIDSNLRSAETDGPTGPNRPVGTFFENAAREARPAFGYVGRALRIVLGAFLLLTAGGALIPLTMALGTALGLFPHDTVDMWDSNTRYMILHDVPDWGKVAGFLVFGVPTLALFLLGLRLLLRRPMLSSTGSLVLLGLWLAGLVGSGAAIAQYVRLTRERATFTTTRTFSELNNPGVVLDIRDQEDYYDWVRMHVAAADSLAPVVAEQEFRAKGPTQTAARLTAQETILYNIAQRDSTLLLDEGITLRENSPSRDQHLTVTLHLPLNRTYTLTPRFIRHLDEEDFVDNRRPDDEKEYRARLTRQGKFRCLNCPPSEDDDNEASNLGRRREDDNDDEVVNFDLNGNRMRVRVNTDGDSPEVNIETEPARFNTDPSHYGTERKTLNDVGSFDEVEVHGAVRVVVRRGDDYRVEAAGRSADLRTLRLSRSGDRVTVRQQGSSFNLFSLGDRNNHAVLVTVILPRLRHLSLGGACLADVSGLAQEEALSFEASGASALHLSANLPKLSIDLDGLSRADLSGQVEQLNIESSGSCQVEALNMQAVRTKVDMSGSSKASVRASEELNVDLSGSCEVRYAGQPRVEQDLSGSSRLEQVKE